MTTGGAVIAALILAIEVAAVAMIALRVAAWCCEAPASAAGSGGADTPDLLLVGGVTAVGTVVGIITVLGMVDLARRGPVLVAFVIAGALSRLVPRRELPPLSALSQAGLGARIVAIPGVTVAIIATYLGARGKSTEYDTRQYHLPNAAFWLQTHNLWRLPPTEPGYFTNGYPSNGELTGLWLMLPTHGSQLVFVVNVVFGLLLVAAAAVAARELGGRACTGALAGLAVVTAPIVFQTQVDSLLTDLAATAGILAGVAFALRAARSPSQSRWAVLCGLSIGLGYGSKDTALLPAIGVIVLVFLLVQRSEGVRSAAIAAVSSLALGGFWFIRNIADLSNPVYPLRVAVGGHEIFGGGSGPLVHYSTSLANHLAHGRTAPLHEWEKLARTLVGPVGLLALLGMVLPLVFRRRAPFLVGGLAAACFLAYLLTPYTGGGVQGLAFLIGSQLRYVMPALAVGVVVAVALMPRTSVAIGVVAVFYGVWKDLHARGFRADLHVRHAVLAVAVIGGLAAFVLPSVVPRISALLRPVLVSVAALAVAVAAFAVVDKHYGPHGPSSIDRAVAQSGHPGGPIMAIGIADVSALYGNNFRLRVVTPSGSGTLSAAQLAAAVLRNHPSAVVVGTSAYAAVPPGWTPPGYRAAGKLAVGNLYLAP